jgi:hypothetical protein
MVGRFAVGRRPSLQHDHVGGIFTIKQYVDTQTPVKCSGPGEDVSQHGWSTENGVRFQVKVKKNCQGHGNSTSYQGARVGRGA